jgi:hypothetical protein
MTWYRIFWIIISQGRLGFEYRITTSRGRPVTGAHLTTIQVEFVTPKVQACTDHRYHHPQMQVSYRKQRLPLAGAGTVLADKVITTPKLLFL